MGVFTMNSLLPEELIHERSHLLSLGEEQQVSSVDDVEPRMGNQARHDPCVDGWNDRVVVASQDQGRLTELMQPGQAGPAHACKQLPVVPETVRCSDQVRIRTSEVGPLAEYAAIEGRGYGGQVRWLQVPTRTQQFGEDTGPARNRDCTRRGRHQHQAAAALRVLAGELLSQPSASRDAQDIHFLMPYSVKQLCNQASEASEAQREEGGRRPSNTGDIKANRPDLLPSDLVERSNERVKHFQVGPDAIDQQEWGPVAISPTYVHKDTCAVDVNRCGCCAGMGEHHLLLLVHIRPRCFNQGDVRAIANRRRGRLLGAGAGEQPRFPMLPPTATVPGRTRTS